MATYRYTVLCIESFVCKTEKGTMHCKVMATDRYTVLCIESLSNDLLLL